MRTGWIIVAAVIFKFFVKCDKVSSETVETSIYSKADNSMKIHNWLDIRQCPGDLFDIESVDELEFDACTDVKRRYGHVGNGKTLQCVNSTACDKYAAFSATCRKAGFYSNEWSCRFRKSQESSFTIDNVKVDCENDKRYPACFYRGSCILLYTLKGHGLSWPSIVGIILGVIFILYIIFIVRRKCNRRNRQATTTTIYEVPTRPATGPSPLAQQQPYPPGPYYPVTPPPAYEPPMFPTQPTAPSAPSMASANPGFIVDLPPNYTAPRY